MNCLAVIGTRAQAIKMAPVVNAIRQQGVDCRIVLTGQHKATVEDLLHEFDLQPDSRLYGEDEVTTIAGGLGWLFTTLPRAIALCRGRRELPMPDVVLVHGDTMSTLIGAVAGRFAGCEVAHVEAGLRSGSLLDPFPEEAIRRMVTRLSQLAYCPGSAAVAAAMKSRGEIVDSVENTILDALREVLCQPGPSHDGEYVVVSAHRLETVMRPRQLRRLYELTVEVAEAVPVRFVLHPVTESRLRRAGLLDPLRNHARIETLPRMGYAKFIRLAASSRAVLTDGGGNQEEMAYLGIPTIVLRRHTERHHGIGTTTHLTGLDLSAVMDALQSVNVDRGRVIGAGHPPTATPSATIASHLKSWLAPSETT